MVICAIGGDKETTECLTHIRSERKNGQKVYKTRVEGITKWKQYILDTAEQLYRTHSNCETIVIGAGVQTDQIQAWKGQVGTKFHSIKRDIGKSLLLGGGEAGFL